MTYRWNTARPGSEVWLQATSEGPGRREGPWVDAMITGQP
jgi:hypothetical protein